ncbi:YaaC family protein [Thalassobacillus sp. CUG 92003]|uniref:YaaC family protein n=1 Tax=Thalassobacillus sp. CUG 92003 TaxID=2736641 RepID=UPI0015E679CD|nr:YaaC family protein [Thalassobacillus sp. CUG 92003]
MERFHFLIYLQAVTHAKQFLDTCYANQGDPKHDLQSYRNSDRFCYLLSQGLSYFETGKHADIGLQPLLYFYGLEHFMKANILTVRPDYPDSTKVLAHGLSTRKRKKQHYRFREDEVRIQPNGLFPYAARHLFNWTYPRLPEKAGIDDMLRQIPEMAIYFHYKEGEEVKTPGAVWPELLTHFILLYNLSMLVRYEVEWWGEMQQLRDREDFTFIKGFLLCTGEKVPRLVEEWLHSRSFDLS